MRLITTKGSSLVLSLLLILLNISTGYSQSPGGIFDTVADGYGNKYPISSITYQPNNGTSQPQIVAATCPSGYFQLYFETGSGFEGTSTTHQARRQVLCQLFSDISAFINSPLTTTGKKVNILVRDVNTISTNPSVVGIASTLYMVPGGFSYGINSGAMNGIIDNAIRTTILSGQDAFANTVVPIFTSGYWNDPILFHGYIAFNFNNNFNLQLNTSTIGNSEFDLYSVALHEISHAMGFSSMITYETSTMTGKSLIPNFFNRYDTKLFTQNNEPLIKTGNNACSYMYGYSFNSTLNAQTTLNPNLTNCINDHTNCPTAIQYVGGTTQFVYTPNCFQDGKSLSHFEDECPPISNNNGYFTMSDNYIIGQPSFKRSLTEEERIVFCDLGYNVNAIYGNSANFTYHSYTAPTCPGAQVAGINDGISNGMYLYTVVEGNTIQIGNVLSNDYNAQKLECLDLVAGSGSAILTSSTSFSYTPSVSPYGIHVLRYIPVNTQNNERGNITYVFIRVIKAQCATPACYPQEMIANGDFESPQGCGYMQEYSSSSAHLDCWNDFIYLPDLLSSSSACTNPLFGISSSATWNGGANNNHQFIGLQYSVSGTDFAPEGLQTLLSYPVVPSGMYTITFHAKNRTSAASSVSFYGAPNPLVTIPGYLSAFPTSNLVAFGTVNINSTSWNSYSLTFTCPAGSSPLQTLTMNATAGDFYIDDISMVPTVGATASIASGLIALYGTGSTITTSTSFT